MAHKSVFVNSLKTPKGRISFPHLADPDTKGEYADDKFKVTLLIPKDDASDAMKKLKAAVMECAKQAWPKKNLAFKDLMHPFRNGDDKDKLDGYPGTVFITCKTKKRPRIVNKAREDIDRDDIADEIYAGCYARLVVTACSYESAGKPGVTFLLDIVQKLGDGERMGGAGGASVSALDDGEFDDDESDPLDAADSDEGDDDLFG